MKRILVLAAVLLLVAAGTAGAASPMTYRVTAPVIELRDDAIVVAKGEEKWEIARDKDTKVAGDIAVGSVVTVLYRMRAASVELKPDGRIK